MKKVTMQQVAEHVGVSKFAVSQALSGKPGVSRETREKIIEAAALLGYISNRPIRQSPPAAFPAEYDKRTKHSVIILVPNIRYQNSESAFWGPIIGGVTSALEEQGCNVLLVTEHNSMHFMNIINPGGVLGLIGIGVISTRMLLDIRQAAIPMVLIDHEDPLVPSDTIFMNNYDSLRRVTARLTAHGHQRLRFVGDPHYSRSFHDRWLGFRSMIEELNLPVPEKADPLLALEAGKEMFQIAGEIDSTVSRSDLPSAFVCANDTLALWVVESLHNAGVSVPDTVSVTGFDNLESGSVSAPALSTVNVPKEMMGRRAVAILLLRLNQPERPVEKTLISGDILMRESVASPQ